MANWRLSSAVSPRAVAPRKYLAPGQEKLQRALRQALPSLHQALPPLVPHLLPAVDNGELRKNANKDGRASLEEAQHAALQHFDAADLNHDGTLTPDERRQASKAGRAKRPAG